MQRALNILRVYHQASVFEIEAGLRWYLTAHEEAVRIVHENASRMIASSSTSPAEFGAAVIAALSPGLRWERNIEAAERLFRREGLEGLGIRWYDGVRKAERILSGESVIAVLRGNKVLAFWQNIARPLSSDSVCIDGHAYAIWCGERIFLDDVPPLSTELYRRIERDYAEAAGLVGIRPLQLQAITWTTWRRLHGVNSAHYLPLFEESKNV